jgi:hypothetical protein
MENETKQMNDIRHVIRQETLFAGIRKPIKSRQELIPRIAQVREACGDAAIGPLTHIFRFDTPVDGYDSEIGFPVSKEINIDAVRTHRLRKLHFFAATHRGPVDTLRDTALEVYRHMDRVGLAPELERVEIYHRYDPAAKPGNETDNEIEVLGAFLAWPEVYREQLLRVLGPDLTAEIWAGGEAITPFTLVDERAAWVAASLDRLKQRTDQDQQFDILSRVALVRPAEDTMKYKKIYEEHGGDAVDATATNRIEAVKATLAAQNETLQAGPSGGRVDPPWFDGQTLHLSKVPYNREAYDAATGHDELRRAYCFCALIREAEMPQVDPIFCYRAAGWARQFWEPILGVTFKRCTITHSILKGDPFCAWDYDL